MDTEQVIIEVEAGECAECDGRVWDVYRSELIDGEGVDRKKIGTHGKKPAAKKVARELAEADRANGARVALKYPEGARTVTEDYEPEAATATADEVADEAEAQADAASY